jgi:glycosyltransferase involved in cell wall biosynthesis
MPRRARQTGPCALSRSARSAVFYSQGLMAPEVSVRIGLIAPAWIPVPPPAYGGTEAVLDCLARGLTEMGHDVRLFTVGESTCPVSTSFLYPTAVEPMGDVAAELAHVLSAYEALADVDVIHDHTLAGSLVTATNAVRPPVAVTHHGAFSADMRRIFAAISRRAATIAISQAQARSAGTVPIEAVIHHGIDLTRYVPGPGDGGYVLFLGRMSPDKGVHHAVRVARRAGRPLVLATKMRAPEEYAYFERAVRPLLSASVEVLIEPGLTQRIDLLQHAEALLNPICWPEPFGLVMPEAMVCGTPVLAFPNGSAPEIVEHRRTGYLCADEAEMLAALDRVSDIDRVDCSTAAQQRFSMARMAAEHDLLYRRLAAGDLEPTRPKLEKPLQWPAVQTPRWRTVGAPDRSVLKAPSR